MNVVVAQLPNQSSHLDGCPRLCMFLCPFDRFCYVSMGLRVFMMFCYFCQEKLMWFCRDVDVAAVGTFLIQHDFYETFFDYVTLCCRRDTLCFSAALLRRVLLFSSGYQDMGVADVV